MCMFFGKQLLPFYFFSFLVIFPFSTSIESKQLNESIPIPKIINGTPVNYFSSFPWMVSLWSISSGVYIHSCGGSVIQDGWVLTAAHCVVDDPYIMQTNVYTGSTNLTYGGYSFGVDSVYYHSGYNPTTIVNDIALIRVNGIQRISNFSLASQSKVEGLVKNTLVELSGWGLVQRYGQQTIDLRWSLLYFLDGDDCRNEFSSRTWNQNIGSISSTNNICAGQPQNLVGTNQSPCHGDSGGPLILREGNNAIQIGIVSWGEPANYGIGCGFNGEPGVFTNVGSYRQWIDYVIQSYENNTISKNGRFAISTSSNIQNSTNNTSVPESTGEAAAGTTRVSTYFFLLLMLAIRSLKLKGTEKLI